eukprot:2842273-Ditylum_brightwellii.AAC.1
MAQRDQLASHPRVQPGLHQGQGSFHISLWVTCPSDRHMKKQDKKQVEGGALVLMKVKCINLVNVVDDDTMGRVLGKHVSNDIVFAKGVNEFIVIVLKEQVLTLNTLALEIAKGTVLVVRVEAKLEPNREI